MSLPKKIRDKSLKRLKFIEMSADSFNTNASETQKPVFNKLRRMIMTRLDIDDNGRIKQTAKNLKEVQRFRTIRNEVLSDSYKKEVAIFINKFDAVKEQTDNYYKALPENA